MRMPVERLPLRFQLARTRTLALATIVGGLCACFAPSPSAQDGTLAPAEYAAELVPSEWSIGATIPDLGFVDLDGNAGHLSDYASSKALVVVIRDVGCPVSKKYGLRTAEIERDCAAKGVAFLYVNPTEDDDVHECRVDAKRYGFAGRYTSDLLGRFGWHLKVRTTADAFVLDPARRLCYRGPIDDQIGRGATRVEVKRHFLCEAIDAVVAGQAVAASALTAPGCLLEFLTEPPPEPLLTDPGVAAVATPAKPLTWYGRVESIARARCQGCHHDGGAGPFPLMTAGDFAGAATMVREAIEGAIMPPWFATDASGPFKNDMRLSPPEKAALLEWLAAGAPEGDATSQLPPPNWPSGWTIGEPDLIVESPKLVDIPATGVVEYLVLDAPTKLTEDVWVQAIQILCDHPTICHHVLAHAHEPATNRQEFIDSYLPGRDATVFPPDQALLLKKGAVIRFNLHYTPNGTPVKERTRIGFKFAKEKPKYRVSGQVVRSYEINIPPHAAHHVVVSEYRFTYDAVVRRLVPHMHLRGKAVQVEFVAPDGSSTMPLEMATWHPNWQYAYEFVTPIAVERGTLVRCTSYYDNSAKNPFNPAPEKRVVQGPQIWDEMAGVFVESYRRADAASARDRGPREPTRPRRDGSTQRPKSGGEPDDGGGAP
ncbi:MAG: hypothetical protein EXS13_09775 [Planctomycetes bacterium]|nr:hypothetical protein [Planctomycetota bacterium]